jgi:hypothetical protein
MDTIQQNPNTNYTRFMWTAVALAFFAAIFYILMEFNLLGVGDLRADEKPSGIIYIVAGCYICGGLFILLRKRGLLIFGAVTNAMVIFFFFAAYQNRPTVMFSAGGLVSKTVQILLEIALLYLIFAKKQK